MATRDGTRGHDQDIPNHGVPVASSVGAPIAPEGAPESSRFGDLQLDHLVDDQVQPSRGITFVVCEACGGSMPARPCPLGDPMNGATTHDVCEACKPAYEAQIRELETLEGPTCDCGTCDLCVEVAREEAAFEREDEDGDDFVPTYGDGDEEGME